MSVQIGARIDLDAAATAARRVDPNQPITPPQADFYGLALTVATLLIETHGGATHSDDDHTLFFLPGGQTPPEAEPIAA